MSDKYKVEKIQAENVAIGNRARAEHITQPDAQRTAMQAEALHHVRQLIELLEVHCNEIDHPEMVQADAKSVEIALKGKKLNRARIENLIGKIALAVAGVTALATAINAVQVAISHLFP